MVKRDEKRLFVYEVRAKDSAYSYGIWYGTIEEFRKQILQNKFQIVRKIYIRQRSSTGRLLIKLLSGDSSGAGIVNDALDDLILLALDLA